METGSVRAVAGRIGEPHYRRESTGKPIQPVAAFGRVAVCRIGVKGQVSPSEVGEISQASRSAPLKAIVDASMTTNAPPAPFSDNASGTPAQKRTRHGPQARANSRTLDRERRRAQSVWLDCGPPLRKTIYP
jgi:hypothetical protein